MPLIAGISSQDSNKFQFRNLLSTYKILPGEIDEDYEVGVKSISDSAIGFKIKKLTLDSLTVLRVSDADIYCLGFNEFIEGIKNKHNRHLTFNNVIKRIKKADGEYIITAVDDKALIHIISDSNASRPCFYSELNGKFYFSSNITFLGEILPTKLSFDVLGLLQLMNIDHTVGGRTTFNELKRVRPAEHLTILGGKIIKREQYHTLKYFDFKINDYRDFAEEVYKSLRESVEQRSSGKSGFISLSGGLDSRLIASVVDSSRFEAFTFINSMSEKSTPDVEYSKKVAAALNLSHTIKSIDSYSMISESINNTLRLTGGQVSILHSSKVNVYIDQMKKIGFHLGGGPGDTLAGSQVFSHDMHLNSRTLQCFINHKIKYKSEHLEFIIKNFYQNALNTTLSNSIGDSLIEKNENILPKAVTLWGMNERQPAFTLNSPIHNHPDVAESSPHLGYDYEKKMLCISGEDLLRKNFYKFMIYHCIPELRDIEYANTGKRIDSKLIDQYYATIFFKISSFYNKVGIKLDTYLQKLIPRYAKSFQYEMIFNDKDAIHLTKQILMDNKSVFQFLNVDNCIQLLNDFENKEVRSSISRDANIIGFLITITHLSNIFDLKYSS